MAEGERMRKFRLCVNWFMSPALLCKFVWENKIPVKNIISINTGEVNGVTSRWELWWYSRKRWSDLQKVGECDGETEN